MPSGLIAGGLETCSDICSGLTKIVRERINFGLPRPRN